MAFSRRFARLVLVSLAVASGCGSGHSTNHSSPLKRSSSASSAPAAAEDAVVADDIGGAAGGAGGGEAHAGSAPGAAGNPSGAAAAKPRASSPKIIYTGELTLQVDDVQATDAAIAKLAAQLGGYVAANSVSGEDAGGRYGQWTLRLPAARLEAALTSLEALGKVTNLQRDAKDVTADYVDVETHLANARLEEEHLRGYLKLSKTLTETLAVEKELARVRTAIDSAQGQLNVLKDQVEMTKLTVSAAESHQSLGAMLHATFDTLVPQALEILAQSVRALIWTSVAVLPWAIPLAFVIRLLLKRRRRKLLNNPSAG